MKKDTFKIQDLNQEVKQVQLSRGNQIFKAPQQGLTASDGTLANAVIRIGQLETALRNLGLLK